ncbi:hypothetical protein HMPREF1146_1979 [Prevotella sp. MSX73]|nr:hypothetical protein HMPREF1146_1979 [Prevotella sp. MSX73]
MKKQILTRITGYTEFRKHNNLDPLPFCQCYLAFYLSGVELHIAYLYRRYGRCNLNKAVFHFNQYVISL